jgi:hypothetical protein
MSEDRPQPIMARLDALPYIDSMDEDYHAHALSLVEAEMETLHAPAADVQPLEAIRIRTEIFESEYEQRMQRDGPLPALLVSESSSVGVDSDDIEQVRAAVKRARIAYEKERLREVALSVERDESSVHWKNYLDRCLTPQHAALQAELERQRSIVEQVNLKRQREQEDFGRDLDRKSRQYNDLIAKRIQLQLAISQLEQGMQQP